MFFSKKSVRQRVEKILSRHRALDRIDTLQETEDGKVILSLKVDGLSGQQAEDLRRAIETGLVSEIKMRPVIVIMTAERPPASKTASKPASLPPSQQEKILLPGVKQIVAVASGKGGVGKSTVSVNLAVALAVRGLKIGLLDADIYGPSVPAMTGLPIVKPEFRDGKIQPFTVHGIKVMSLGFLLPENAPLIWRGPMVQSAVTQLLRDVEWGDLDLLMIDLPPGTGDAQLTLTQKIHLDGAVIVSTPQDISLIDARKGLEMFRKLDVPIIGLIENMSYYCCPSCGHRDEIFSHGGAKDEAKRLDCHFLGEIPLDRAIRAQSDDGQPLSSPLASHIYAELAQAFRAALPGTP